MEDGVVFAHDHVGARALNQLFPAFAVRPCNGNFNGAEVGVLVHDSFVDHLAEVGVGVRGTVDAGLPDDRLRRHRFGRGAPKASDSLFVLRAVDDAHERPRSGHTKMFFIERKEKKKS